MTNYTTVGRDEDGFDVTNVLDFSTIKAATLHAKRLVSDFEYLNSGCIHSFVFDIHGECVADFFAKKYDG
jgi:hypothetical protein